MQVGNITESSWAKAGSAYQTKSDNITKTDNKTQKASQASPKANDNSKTNAAGFKNTKNSDVVETEYTKGRIIGKPTLSKKAAEIYENLQKKYGNMSFILVSEDQKNVAQANAAAYANSGTTVVLINEDKLEQMASDESYARQIEAKIDAARKQLPSLKQSLAASGAKVKGYGIQVNDNGTTSFFAVMDKSMTEQRERIAEKREEKKAEAKAESKKEAKARQEEHLEEVRKEHALKAKGPNKKEDAEETTEENQVAPLYSFDNERMVFFKADTIDDLISQVNDFQMNYLSNTLKTPEEEFLGTSIDFKG
jgi:hypothetical protein